MNAIASERDGLIRQMICATPSAAVPRLWCPPITHYAAGGRIDAMRMAAHWRTMVAHVGGFLVPGSTGEAWDMAAGEIAELVEVALDVAADLGTRVLVGVLRPTVEEVHAGIAAAVASAQRATGENDVATALRRRAIAGFTVCAPRGSDLTQAQIQTALESILDLGLPTAVYQLPQVTQNEISPEVFAALAARYPNLMLFKDTSGLDRVPLADRGASGVFLVRGAEGRYAQWLQESGGPYRGLLLSTANGFAEELRHVIALLEAGNMAEAVSLSDRLSDAVSATFAAVAAVPHANAFANANKAIDHFMAHGPAAVDVAPPLLHGGVRLPVDVIREVGAILDRTGFMPTAGYLAH
ncbi:MAG: dihydrodipicolinate synthase family protein [Anaerolineae bacterium]|nr:dihydrodipicolinate synthase family protein [Anaerolineae bacterium]